jgi:hypothetical protein
VVGVVGDQGVGDPVRAVGHRAGDHAALLATLTQGVTVAFRGRVVEPEPDREVDRARRSSTLRSRLIDLSRRLPADSYWLGESPETR